VFLNGGRGNDTFSLGDGRSTGPGDPPALFANILGAVTVDGGTGTNTLDYSNLPIGVRVNLALGTAMGASGGVKNIQNVSGGQGNDIIVGNNQSNFIFGNGGRDILIGEGGSDVLFGGAGDDILIGDSTVYDTNPAALESLMAEWARTDLTGTAQDQYNQRINHLLGVTPGGLNGATTLNFSKVISDGVEDGLAGNGDNDSDPDWFFLTGTDGAGDLAPGERVN
jgi:Ca2+-binding RTX toxin-like protein